MVGEISQDLDLFRMPVELKDRYGREDGRQAGRRRRHELARSAIETFGKPRRIVVDPDNNVLKNSIEICAAVVDSARAGIGAAGRPGRSADGIQQSARDQQEQLARPLPGCARSSSCRRNYQAAANAYREALNGDGDPRWTEVWCHIRLGNIFDITGQRERAVNEYRQAIQTNDNTQGAIGEAQRYIQKPYEQQKNGM